MPLARLFLDSNKVCHSSEMGTRVSQIQRRAPDCTYAEDQSAPSALSTGHSAARLNNRAGMVDAETLPRHSRCKIPCLIDDYMNDQLSTESL